MPTNNLSPKSKNKLGIASSIPPKMSERFGSAVLPYLQSVQSLFPPANPYGQATSNFLLGQAPQAAQRMAEGYPNVLFNTSNPLGGKRIVNPVALDMAVALPIGTALKGAGLAGGGVAATFAGVGAKTANREALLVAERMKAAGAPDEEIYKATGWFFGSADGKPRFEIDDSASMFNASGAPGSRVSNDWPHASMPDENYGPAVGRYAIMDHPALEKAYGSAVPNTFVRNKNTLFGDGALGSFDPATESITMYAPAKAQDARSTMLHELQHAVQQREGFARGGNPEMAFRDKRVWGESGAEGSDVAHRMLKEKMREMATPMPIEDYAKQAWQSDIVTPEIVADYASYAKNIKKNAANFGNEAQKTVSQTWYKRLAGEAEARLTQSRMDMTGAERAANYPPSMYDVPVGDQIVRYGDGPALATTWHGSPHKFEPTELNDLGEFNAAKIGTGEGAQAYSHGHYTGEARGTGEGYMTGGGGLQKAVTTPNVMIDGKWSQSMPRSSVESQAATAFANDLFGATIPQKVAKLRAANMGGVADFLEQNANKFQLSKGYLYKVDIPDEHIAQMLDWDKPLSEQNKEVRDYFESFAAPKRINMEKQRLNPLAAEGSANMTYNPIGGRLLQRYGEDNSLNPENLAKELQQAGIPGVRYLDKASRGATGGTSNFVVFPGNEHMMTILERNGQAMSPESQAIARYREIKGPKSVVRMEAALRTAGVPLPKNEPVAYIQRLVDRAHRRN